MTNKDFVLYFSLKYNGDWEKIYAAILNKEEIDEKEFKKLTKNISSKYITMFDDEYPECLAHCFRPPFVLYYHGDIKLLDCKLKSVGVVGSRKNSSQGEKDCIEIVSELAKEVTIVSGMAHGIDAIAHRAAINAGGKTIAVLGSGINYIYPEDNEDLYNIIKKDHLVISEYPDKMPPSVKTFPIRNRIVAALTNCLFIPEGKVNSGTSITATMVLNAGGSVCCCPTTRGNNSLCNYLIKYGACLVETVDDIYYEMNYKKPEPEFQ